MGKYWGCQQTKPILLPVTCQCWSPSTPSFPLPSVVPCWSWLPLRTSPRPDSGATPNPTPWLLGAAPTHTPAAKLSAWLLCPLCSYPAGQNDGPCAPGLVPAVDIPGNKSPIWVSIWGKLESWIFMNQSKSLVLRIKKKLISIEKVSFTDIYTKKILADIHILDEHLQKQQKSIDMNNVKISVIDIWNICLWLQNSKINIVPFQYLWYSCTSIKGSKSQVLSLHIGLFLKQQSFSAQQVHQLAVVGLVAGFSDCFSVS